MHKYNKQFADWRRDLAKKGMLFLMGVDTLLHSMEELRQYYKMLSLN